MTFPWWSLLPFVAMLASIAVLPILPATAHWWEKQSSQLTIALVLGVPVAIWMWIALGWQVVFASVVEYAQFIALLLALFVVSGAIFFAKYAPEGQNPWIYSIVYNATFIIPALILSAITALILWKRFLDKGVVRETEKPE